MIKLNAKQLRNGENRYLLKEVARNEIYIVLDNVLDTYNIGSIFRLADAVAAKKVYLCGNTATPPNPRIKKASINTTEIVEWEYALSCNEILNRLRLNIPNLQIIAIEQIKKAVPYNKFSYKFPICLIVGNETEGISKEVLSLVDVSVEIPMYGINISLNVMVSLGIILYTIIGKNYSD